ncbi:hypothetical protein [Algoriphagus sp. Y33]|nr:hypothetical protein [Algoriphagus sp. Y33]
MNFKGAEKKLRPGENLTTFKPVTLAAKETGTSRTPWPKDSRLCPPTNS